MLNSTNLKDNVNSYLTKLELYGSNFSIDLGEPFTEEQKNQMEYEQYVDELEEQNEYLTHCYS